MKKKMGKAIERTGILRTILFSFPRKQRGGGGEGEGKGGGGTGRKDSSAFTVDL